MDLTNYKITEVTLNVNNLSKMSHFYQEIMGLTLLKEETDLVILGIKETKTALLTLKAVKTLKTPTSGLYHVAYLLPNRNALGNFLRHIAVTQYPLQGASDHGYSEAIYLADPEGNGIEVYADKDEFLWDIRDNGIIVGVTEPMDVEGVLEAADEEFEKMTPETFIGHVHLAVSEVAETSRFFTDILAFTITTEFGQQAAFYGKDGYHHQFAGNVWETRHAPKNDPLAPGLAGIKVALAQEVFNDTLTALERAAYPFDLQDNELNFVDPNNIAFRYQVN
ncbi:MAG: VOC family protein [Vagococcus salmoninarum]|uniref:VOC family protein n=1 Tax=Vagococcus salmoninarum TaxID=2739 RepID=UPI003F96DBD6